MPAPRAKKAVRRTTHERDCGMSHCPTETRFGGDTDVAALSSVRWLSDLRNKINHARNRRIRVTITARFRAPVCVPVVSKSAIEE